MMTHRRAGRGPSEGRQLERAVYCRMFPGCWDGVSEWIEAVVERCHDGWAASGFTSFPNQRREQWNTRRVFASREEAARFAADYVSAAEALVAALERGEVPFLPHRGMAAACDAALAQDGRLLRLTRQLEQASDNRARSVRRRALESARRDATTAWHNAHDWRDFTVARKAA